MTLIVSYWRHDVNRGNYKQIERCKNVATLTSGLKMFLRDLPNPLLDRKVVDLCLALDLENSLKVGCNVEPTNERIRDNLKLLSTLHYDVLHFIMLHLSRVGDNQENKMSLQSLAIIFGQNLVPNKTPESNSDIAGILLEAEKTNIFIELLIKYVHEIFVKWSNLNELKY